MMARALAAIVVGFVFLAPLVSAHPPPEPEVPAEPDPNAVGLLLVALDKQAAKANYTSSGCCYGPQLYLGLSDDVNDSVEPSRVTTLGHGMLIGACTPYSPCHQPYSMDDVHWTGEDFRLNPLDIYEGALHFSYNFRMNGPINLQSSSNTIGYVYASLVVDDWSYGTISIPLKGTSGDVHMPLAFEREECTDYNHYHNATGDNLPCEGANMSEVVNQPWTHDVGLHIRVQVGYQDWEDQVWGNRLDVKFDTGGGSYIVGSRYVEPEPEVLAEDIDMSDDAIPVDEAIDAEFTDSDGDGQPELQFAPGPAPLLVAGALATIAALRRRRAA